MHTFGHFVAQFFFAKMRKFFEQQFWHWEWIEAERSANDKGDDLEDWMRCFPLKKDIFLRCTHLGTLWQLFFAERVKTLRIGWDASHGFASALRGSDVPQSWSCARSWIKFTLYSFEKVNLHSQVTKRYLFWKNNPAIFVHFVLI